ncbi:uncharacterized protein FIBRA_03285 [Fibroporia radiculosa]|uniref:Major facilitator superfamily (MFS) profile domain-containing protein n=1 Tax=Fibroporia radiculosa TaxID=599839 RepID=J4HVW8_9APHY|nr:uncharacterized protein FIBRA_03285 [Fibroporia radiculosa]CCM01237.1 predicted protein [Fibroporia radiculosa]
MNAREAKADVSMTEGAAQDEEKSLAASPTIPALSSLEDVPEAEITYPEGGLWIVNFCTFGYSTSFGVCQDYYTVFGASTVSNISWIGSIQMFLLFAMSLPAGRLFDMGYFYHVNIFGSFLFVFCLFMLSIADPSKYYQLLLSQGIGMGIGGGLILTPALSIQSQYFKKRRALALGIVHTAGSSAGGIVYPIMLNKLFYAKAGFAWGMRASAFLTLGLLIISCCVMRTRLPTGRDGVKGATPSVKEVFSHVPYSIAVVSLLMVIIGIFFPYFYLQTWARYYSMSDDLAFYMIAILNAGSFFGRIIPNFLADYVGMFNVLCPVAYGCSVLIFAMFGTTKAAPIIVFSFLYGFFSGSFFALMPPLMAFMARSQAEVGNRIGFAYSTFGLAVLIGTPIDGAVLGPGDSYHWYKALLFSGVRRRHLGPSVIQGIDRFWTDHNGGWVHAPAFLETMNLVLLWISHPRQATTVMSFNEVKSNVSASEIAATKETYLEQNPPSPILTDTTDDSEPEITIPDGGLQAWLVILGAWIVNFCTFGYSTSFGVCQDYYGLAGASSTSNISWIGSIQIFLLFGMGYPAGRLFDLGYFRYLCITGTFLFVFSLFMLSLADPSSYYQLFLAQGVGMGLGGGLLLSPSLSVVSHYWNKKRSLALGVVQSGSCAGGIVYPIMLNKLFSSSAGFAWAIRGSAFLTLVILVASCFLMKTRLPSGKNRLKGSQPSIASIITHKPYTVAVVSLFLVLLGLFFPYFYLQTWARSYHMSETLAFYSIAILNAASIFGKILPNILGDYTGQFNIVCPAVWASSVLIFAMFGTTTPGPLIVFCILYGFFSGSCFSMLPTILSFLARTPAEVGNRIGLGFTIYAVAILIGTPINGALIGAGDSTWYKAILFSGIVMVAGSTSLVYARQLLVKERGSQLI